MIFFNYFLHILLLATSALAKKKFAKVDDHLLTPKKVVRDISLRGLHDFILNMDVIAKQNGGDRAFGLPGYNASVQYVLDKLASPPLVDRYDTKVQNFTFIFEQTRNISLIGPKGEYVAVKSMRYNPPTRGVVQAQLAGLLVDKISGGGCRRDHYDGRDFDGRIALIQKGGCDIKTKLRMAKGAGAVAALIYNNRPGSKLAEISLSPASKQFAIPAGLITKMVGDDWQRRLDDGEELYVDLEVDSVLDTRESWNVITETKYGDPNNVIMLGAHLDSYQGSPGLEDNASGAAALMEVATSFSKYEGFNNKVRFAWWGAEELGLVGSIYYCQNLYEEESKIRFYYNFDQLANKAPVYRAYATTFEDHYGADLLVQYIRDRNVYSMQTTHFEATPNSDYTGFRKLSIPSSGIYLGHNGCNHKACDDMENINWLGLQLSTQAAGYAAATMAMNVTGLPERLSAWRDPPNKVKRDRQEIDDMWETVKEEAMRSKWIEEEW